MNAGMTDFMLSHRRKKYYTVLSNMLIPLGGMSTDIYLPSLPAIAHHFAVDKFWVQLTVTIFVFAMGIGQMVAGPISDSLGRKKLLVVALIAQLMMVVAILLAPSIYFMIFFRFIQGLAVAFMMVPARAILNDIYEGDALKKQLYYITISFAISPILAPLIGGYLQHYIGWQANFFFVLIFIIIAMMLVLFTYRETIASTTALVFRVLWKNPVTLFHHRFFAACTVIAGVLYGYAMIFNVAGPFLVQVEMHHSPIDYGHMALLVGLTWFTGNLINRLTYRIHMQLKSKLALWFSVITCLVFVMFSYLSYFNLPTFIIPLLLLIFFNSFIFSIYVAEALSLFPAMAASANAALFSSAWFIASLFTLYATFLKVHSLLPIALSFTVISLINLGIYYRFLRSAPEQ